MKRETVATGSAIGLSVLIASCCIAPALFLLFGVSINALGALSALEPYQPYFIGAGALALAIAGHQIFRSADAAGSGDTACDTDSRSRRLTRRLFFGAVALFGLAIVYPYLLNFVL